MPERDPDELLGAFERITADVPRPVIPSSRTALVARVAVAALLVAMLATVGGAAVIYGPRSVPAAGDRVQLPTHRDLSGYPAALLTGRLVREGDCVYAASLWGPSRDLVVWPRGTTLVVSEGESVVFDGGGNRIAAIGEPVEMGGGEIPLDHMKTLLETEIPEECAGPYWLAASAKSPLGEARPASWRLATGEPVTAETTSLNVVLTEKECANGLSPEGRLVPPQIEYRADAVEVTLSVRTYGGDCPSNPEYETVVQLSEPIGQRRLIDGSDDAVRWPLMRTVVTHHAANVDRDGTGTGIAGTPIVLEGECLYVGVTGRRWLAIWPTGTTLDESAEPAVIRDALGNRITGLGEPFSLFGASYAPGQLSEIRPLLDAEIPDVCLDVELLLIDPKVAALKPRIGTWRVDQAALPGPASTSLQIEITENACSSRADPRGRTLPPEIEYRRDAVVITLSILEIGGRCPGNPFFPMTIELTEPLGNRSLVDGYDSGVRWRPDVGLVTPSPYHDSCVGLDLPPLAELEVRRLTVREGDGILEMELYSPSWDKVQRVLIRYDDAVCREHPVLGPLIEQAVDGTPPASPPPPPPLPSPTFPPEAPIAWRIDPEEPPAIGDTEIQVLVKESGCSGGRDPSEHLKPPEFRQNAFQMMTITLTVSFDKSSATCPGNREVAVVIDLPEPLGDLSLHDGAEGSAGLRWTPEAPDADLVGRLTSTEIGGCGLLVASGGQLFAVGWPVGYSIREVGDERQLVSPDGEVIAYEGDEIALRGTFPESYGTYCMVGPQFLAGELLAVARNVPP